MEPVSEIIDKKQQDVTAAAPTAELVQTPVGLVPKKHLRKACQMLAIIPDDPENPSVLGWRIQRDTPEEFEKYKEALNTADARGGWDLECLGEIPPSTILRHEIESRVYKAYRARYKSCVPAFESYVSNKYPQIRVGIIQRLHENNTQAKESNMTDKERRTNKEKQRFQKKLEYLNS